MEKSTMTTTFKSSSIMPNLNSKMIVADIEKWLTVTDGKILKHLYKTADNVRKKSVGKAVHLRGLIEISNYCIRQCKYCGLRASNQLVSRYRMSEDDIMKSVSRVVSAGLGTVVIQAGEDRGLSPSFIEKIISKIKKETPLAITLSLGEIKSDVLALWKKAGADRYLLRFETSNNKLYKSIHPDSGGIESDRISILKELKRLGYETGTGIMVGVWGQTCNMIAQDISFFRELDIDMIGLGPYIPHSQTPMAKQPKVDFNIHEMTRKVIALTRIIRPLSNIPATTALETLDPANGVKIALQTGGNIIMPNMTLAKYRKNYDIYPGKTTSKQSDWRNIEKISAALTKIDRTLGKSRGDSLNYVAKN